MHCPVSRSYKWLATQLINQSNNSTSWSWSATRPMTCWPHKMTHDRPSHYQMNSATKTQLTKWPLCYISAKFRPLVRTPVGPTSSVYSPQNDRFSSPVYLWPRPLGRRWPLAWIHLLRLQYVPGVHQGAVVGPLCPPSWGSLWCPQSAYSDGLPSCSFTETSNVTRLQTPHAKTQHCVILTS